MAAADSPHPLSDFARALVRRQAGRLVGRAGLRPQDQDDLEQELTVELLRSLEGQADRADCPAFLTTVVRRLAANIVRKRKAQKRDDRGTISLEVSDAETASPLAALVSRREQDARLGRESRTDEELSGMRLDLNGFLAKLLPGDRDLLLRVMQTSLAQVARDLGVARTTLHARLGRLRERFEQGELQEYLNPEKFFSCRRHLDREPGN